MKIEKEKIESKCYHCGVHCKNDLISIGDKVFCCPGCKAVYEVLNETDLCSYYSLTDETKSCPGKKCNSDDSRFDYLEDKAIQKKIIEFKEKNLSSVTFFIPSIHCSSCIWLLEKLYKINPALISSDVDFLKKKLKLTFDNSEISLKEVVKLLASIGYEPVITTDTSRGKSENNFYTKKLYLKIGVAGFCLGNIMLLSFPEYLSLNNFIEGNLKAIFNYLNILLSLPVFFYCASDYFASAFNGLKRKFINIDFPISLGLTALFARSLYEIIFFNNAGFSDSLAGLVFLLLGKLFQSKTFDNLNFERDYKSYFPVSVTKKTDEGLKSISVEKLKKGDRIVILNNEIIPADGILFKGTANIDYSFVTGESIPEQKVLGEIIYAGGKQFGSVIELEVVRTVSQSYLTQLWNDKAFQKESNKNSYPNIQNLANSVSKYFTAAILLIAFGAAFYWWYQKDVNLALNAFTTVLIIACPCAFALTTPFALGNAIRIFGRNKFYLKNANVVEEIAKVNSVVFDKTGTITTTKGVCVEYTGIKLNLCEVGMVKSLVSNSAHPLSKAINSSINLKIIFEITNFNESLSNGLSCEISGRKIILGNLHYILKEIEYDKDDYIRETTGNAFSTNVYLCIGKEIKGYFSFKNKYRDGLENVINDLKKDYQLSVISGDNNFENSNLKKVFGFENEENLLFKQTPYEKLNFIKSLQKKNKRVLMLGDGLNDAGALKQSNVGISLTEDVSNFSPACDAIIDASEFSKLAAFMKYSRTTMNIIKVSFGISFLYNVIGLCLAVQGTFSPLVAAVLMPFNSISIILFVIGSTNLIAKRRKLI